MNSLKDLEKAIEQCASYLDEIKFKFGYVENEYQTLQEKLKSIKDIADDYNRPQKTCQYYMDGWDEILKIIDEV